MVIKSNGSQMIDRNNLLYFPSLFHFQNFIFVYLFMFMRPDYIKPVRADVCSGGGGFKGSTPPPSPRLVISQYKKNLIIFSRIFK